MEGNTAVGFGAQFLADALPVLFPGISTGLAAKRVTSDTTVLESLDGSSWTESSVLSWRQKSSAGNRKVAVADIVSRRVSGASSNFQMQSEARGTLRYHIESPGQLLDGTRLTRRRTVTLDGSPDGRTDVTESRVTMSRL